MSIFDFFTKPKTEQHPDYILINSSVNQNQTNSSVNNPTPPSLICWTDKMTNGEKK